MGRKIVNLDDKDNTLEITIGGKTWEIARVAIRLREMYGDYVQHAAGYIETLQGYGESEDLDELQELAEVYATEKARKLDAMMEKLLTKNGYEYDVDWWAENVGDYRKMEEFIVACLNKDQDDDKKKVVDEDKESLTSTE